MPAINKNKSVNVQPASAVSLTSIWERMNRLTSSHKSESRAICPQLENPGLNLSLFLKAVSRRDSISALLSWALMIYGEKIMMLTWN